MRYSNSGTIEHYYSLILQAYTQDFSKKKNSRNYKYYLAYNQLNKMNAWMKIKW